MNLGAHHVALIVGIVAGVAVAFLRKSSGA